MYHAAVHSCCTAVHTVHIYVMSASSGVLLDVWMSEELFLAGPEKARTLDIVLCGGPHGLAFGTLAALTTPVD